MAATPDSDSGPALSFRDEAFLISFHLAVGNALEYFEFSNFYDRLSLNEQAKQNRQASFEDLIQSVSGISFRVVFAQARGFPPITGDDLKKPANQTIDVNPGLVVIDKVNRDGSVEIVLKKYYILDGTIFEAPDLYSILSVRTRSALYHIRESLREVRSMFDWTLETGFRKQIAAHETETRYEVRTSELREIAGEIQDESRLQTTLIETLLAELGINEPAMPLA
jgi:mediator of RNA polymerase II transcription subunit 6